MRSEQRHMGLDTTVGHPQLENIAQSWQKDSLRGLGSEPTPVLEPESETQIDLPAAQTYVVARSLAEKQQEPMPPSPYPKRLIEVDLPIKRISAHARREKSIRHGHISTLHIWWARRPLAACRSVICAALWLDPVDPQCPQVWRDRASELIVHFAQRVSSHLDRHAHTSSLTVWQTLAKSENRLDPNNPAHWNVLRERLLDFIADFANWDNSTNLDYLDISRSLTQAAHEALGGEPGTKPLVVDPFAGGGSIPLEALRVGADAFASDLNPVAVLLNKVVLEYIPKYGQRLADEVRKWGQWVKQEAEKELAEFYPKEADGSTPIAYLWARTITCEGPGCGVRFPLIRQPILRQHKTENIAVYLHDAKPKEFVSWSLVEGIQTEKARGTCKGFRGTCPRISCGYSTPKTSVQRQISLQQGGADQATLLAVLLESKEGRIYRLPTQIDVDACLKAQALLSKKIQSLPVGGDKESLIPDEPVPQKNRHRAVGSQLPLYGFQNWGDLFTSRQKLALTVLQDAVRDAYRKIRKKYQDEKLSKIVFSLLSIAIDKQADYSSSLCRWVSKGEFIAATLGGEKKLPMLSDFAESNPISSASGSWEKQIDWIARFIEREASVSLDAGTTVQSSADNQLLPSNSVAATITDPPYYDSVPYSDLSDYFYVWLRRTLLGIEQFSDSRLTPKSCEMTVNHPNSREEMKRYEELLTSAFSIGRDITMPDGIGVIVFAHKSTSGWEALLEAIVQSGWIVTASWPIDTERVVRMNALGTASLASSVHLVCRPRENPDGSLRTNDIGDWRDVLQELPQRIHDWMPRLADQGVVGADAIFACLGPALEIFSRYSRVEKASGEPVSLKDYLGYVWAAVSKEALSTIFEGADASGFEEDARLTAIWFWVLKAAAPDKPEPSDADAEELQDEPETDEEEKPTSQKKASGYVMEYDAVRKLAQGLGADLGKLSRPGSILVIKGNLATLNPIASRESYLIGSQLSFFNGEQPIYSKGKRGKKDPTVIMRDIGGRQLELLAEPTPPKPQLDTDQLSLPSLLASNEDRPLMERLLVSGVTVLDRLHQAMLLFGRAQTALLGPFLIATTMGSNPHFWQLAQALSALYPPNSEEKRWVDGVLARKKGLGF
ncbi:MAG: DUF1156 domain-containing protein [Leptolyngbyaceae cyanobacterium bins.302]|nr:DUF1156 domain-containing protein [Leptolyngbyaceae cyanobacterium bins.302]